MPSRDGGGPIGQGRHEGGAVHSDLSYPDKRDCAVRQRAKDIAEGRTDVGEVLEIKKALLNLPTATYKGKERN